MTSTIELLKTLCQIPCTCHLLAAGAVCPSCLVVRAQLIAHLKSNMRVISQPAPVKRPLRSIGHFVISSGLTAYIPNSIRQELKIGKGDTIEFYVREGDAVIVGWKRKNP